MKRYRLVPVDTLNALTHDLAVARAERDNAHATAQRAYTSAAWWRSRAMAAAAALEVTRLHVPPHVRARVMSAIDGVVERDG